MQIVSLEPFITELIYHYGCGEKLVGISHQCEMKREVLPSLTIADHKISWSVAPAKIVLEDCIANFRVDLALLKKLRPDLIITSFPFQRVTAELESALAIALSDQLGFPVKIASVAPITFNQVLECYERIAALLGVRERGVDLAQRLKAQAMNWSDNFYDRMKNKRVSFVSSVYPLSLGGRWISDMIKLCSATAQSQSIDRDDPVIDWQEIVRYRPDVIIVSPRGVSLDDSLTSFKAFEKLPEWEQLPATKRGEVIFTEGKELFHIPGPRLIEAMGILVSAIAGLESGYITTKDSFFRLRWLEMQRHRY